MMLPCPEDAYIISPGFFFAIAMRSCSVLASKEGFTSTSSGPRESWMIGVTSFTGYVAHRFNVEPQLGQKAALQCAFLSLVLEQAVLLHARRATNHGAVVLDDGCEAC